MHGAHGQLLVSREHENFDNQCIKISDNINGYAE